MLENGFHRMRNSICDFENEAATPGVFKCTNRKLCCSAPTLVFKGVGSGVDRNLNQFESLPRELQTSIRMLVGGGTRAVVRIAPFYALYELGKRSRAALNAIKSTVVTPTLSRALYTHSNLRTCSPRAHVRSICYNRARAAIPRAIRVPDQPRASPVQPWLPSLAACRG